MDISPFNINIKKGRNIILLVCLLLGFALRFYTFDQKSLWVDEVHTFKWLQGRPKRSNKFYKENPSYLHPPLFFILTPVLSFTKPERDSESSPDLRNPFHSHDLSPCRQFLLSSPSPAPSLWLHDLPHQPLQDGRSYSLLMFLGMAGIYFFMKHLKTSKRHIYFWWQSFLCVILYQL